jgi:hypothetical protein
VKEVAFLEGSSIKRRRDFDHHMKKDSRKTLKNYDEVKKNFVLSSSRVRSKSHTEDMVDHDS